MKIKIYGSVDIYQQLGLLTTLPQKKLKLRFVKNQSKINLDTWIQPLAGQELITITGG